MADLGSKNNPLTNLYAGSLVLSSGNIPLTGQFYNVKDYGAVGNGSTDDTTAIQAAFTAATPGTVVFPSGSYVMKQTITFLQGQGILFTGNPTIKFSLTGTVSGFVVGPSGSPVAGGVLIAGNATIDMQSTGGTVCTLGGNEGYTFGPADGTLQIKNPTGNVIDIGALDNTQALHNITVQNLEVVSGIPGDFINFKANNYTVSPNVAPYIVVTNVKHCSNYPAITGVVGRCVRFNLNAVGPEANLNGLTVEC